MMISVGKDLGQNLITEAIYPATLTGTVVKVSKAGNPMICPTFTINSQGPDEQVKTIGKKVFDNWTLTEAALGVVNTTYKALTGQDLPAGDYEDVQQLIDIIVENVTNRSCLLEIKHEVGNDEVTRNKIKKYIQIK